MTFGREYTEYWASAIKKSVDGTIIAGPEEVAHFIKILNVEHSKSVLDLGCSFGRMYTLLSQYFDNVFGVDIDPYAVDCASRVGYKEVRQGVAEKTNFDNELFDLVFSWAVFDVIDHAKGLIEINRILKSGGHFIITGKNDNYYYSDNLAFEAEKNAFIKGFQNKFTNLGSLLLSLYCYGFEFQRGFIFKNRGDLGLLKYSEIIKANIGNEIIGYEYLIYCKKVRDPFPSNGDSVDLESKFSRIAYLKSREAGFNTPGELFYNIGLSK